MNVDESDIIGDLTFLASYSHFLPLTKKSKIAIYAQFVDVRASPLVNDRQRSYVFYEIDDHRRFVDVS